MCILTLIAYIDKYIHRVILNFFYSSKSQCIVHFYDGIFIVVFYFIINNTIL